MIHITKIREIFNFLIILGIVWLIMHQSMLYGDINRRRRTYAFDTSLQELNQADTLARRNINQKLHKDVLKHSSDIKSFESNRSQYFPALDNMKSNQDLNQKSLPLTNHKEDSALNYTDLSHKEMANKYKMFPSLNRNVQNQNSIQNSGTGPGSAQLGTLGKISSSHNISNNSQNSYHEMSRLLNLLKRGNNLQNVSGNVNSYRDNHTNVASTWNRHQLKKVHNKMPLHRQKPKVNDPFLGDRGCPVKYNCKTGKNINFTISTLEESYEDIRQTHSDVGLGGVWMPNDCQVNQTIALIIPFRNRDANLNLFVKNMIPFLKAQKKAFAIFVIEQAGTEIFNKAHIMNAGFIESQKYGNFSCFIFHDVDMVPVNLCNAYQCRKKSVVHLGISRNLEHPHVVHVGCVGGASAFTKAMFTKINGFTNLLFGWGGEDDEAYYRIIKERIRLVRYLPSIGNYYSLKHRKFGRNFPKVSRGFSIVKQSMYRKYDGLTTVNYTVQKIQKEFFFTRIVVTVTGPNKHKEIRPDYVRRINQIRMMLNETLIGHKTNTSVVDKTS